MQDLIKSWRKSLQTKRCKIVDSASQHKPNYETFI